MTKKSKIDDIDRGKFDKKMNLNTLKFQKKV